MPLVHLPDAWLVVVNILAWSLFHLFPAWVLTKKEPDDFSPEAFLYRVRSWERKGRLYERFFAVRRWKDRLPDGSRFFATAFSKKRLTPSEDRRAYYYRFLQETCRGELIHWIVFLCGFVFFIWNPFWVGWVMVAYAVLVNLPCIIAQRYNRIRLRFLLGSGVPRRNK